MIIETNVAHAPEDCTDCLALPVAADRLAVLGQEQRLHIFRFLMRAGSEGAAVGAIQAHLGIPHSTLSHHLAQLVGADLIAQERQGRSLICRIRFDQMNELLEFLVSECCAGIELKIVSKEGDQ